jgi:predicted transcriptional regulator
MTNITLQLSEAILEQVQSLAGTAENLQRFVIDAIEREVERQQPSSPKQAFWDHVQQIRTQMAADGMEVNSEEIWGDLRDPSIGREFITHLNDL